MTKANDKLPNFLRAWRKRKGLTQERLADLAGFTPGAISQFETGTANFTVPSLISLADVLGCRPGDILSYAPDESVHDPESALRSALLAFGVDRSDIKQVVRLISTYVRDAAPDAPPEETQPRDQSQPANHRRAKEPLQ